MEKEKKDAGFQQLDAAEMKEIKGGGYWYVIKDEKGNIIEEIWIP